MKTWLAGLGSLGLIAVAVVVLRGGGLSVSVQPAPTPSGVPSNWDMAVQTGTANPSSFPTPTPVPAGNKGGVVQGIATGKETSVVTRETKVSEKLVLAKSADCELEVTTYLKEITHDWEVKYWVKDDYSASVTIWQEDGGTVLPETLIQGSGWLTQIKKGENLKIRVLSKSCKETSENWLELVAER